MKLSKEDINQALEGLGYCYHLGPDRSYSIVLNVDRYTRFDQISSVLTIGEWCNYTFRHGAEQFTLRFQSLDAFIQYVHRIKCYSKDEIDQLRLIRNKNLQLVRRISIRRDRKRFFITHEVCLTFGINPRLLLGKRKTSAWHPCTMIQLSYSNNKHRWTPPVCWIPPTTLLDGVVIKQALETLKR